jgi:hypothetical protein
MAATDKMITKWGLMARQIDFHYILCVLKTGKSGRKRYHGILCKDFQEMHDKYHENKDMECEVIRVGHDGSLERHMNLQNLL